MTWPKVKLGDVCEIVSTINPARAPQNETFSYIDIAAVNRDTKQIEASSTLCYANAPSRARQSVKANDVLVSTVRPNLNAVAKVSSEFDSAVASTGFTVLRAKQQSLCESWLFHWVKTSIFVDDMTDKAAGASYPAVSDRIVKDSKIPLPPLAEQKRLAAILDHADELRRARRQSQRVLDELAQSLFLELFGDLTQFKKTPFNDLVSSNKISLVRSAKEVGPHLPVPYIRMNAITRNGELDLTTVFKTSASEQEIKNYSLEKGDFLFNTRNSRELVGKTALFDSAGTYVFNNNILRTRFKESAIPTFVAAVFKTQQIQHELEKRKSGTTNVFAVYYKDLATIQIPLPPLSLQQQFAEQIEELEAIKRHVRESSTRLDALFASLQARAFAGELSGAKA